MGDADEDVDHRKASPAQCIAAEKQQTTNKRMERKNACTRITEIVFRCVRIYRYRYIDR